MYNNNRIVEDYHQGKTANSTCKKSYDFQKIGRNNSSINSQKSGKNGKAADEQESLRLMPRAKSAA